ncbi:hypothetical protein HPB47_026097, partial [Ixodes persulcatus]
MRAFAKNFLLRTNAIYERAKFHRHKQEANETADDFVEDFYKMTGTDAAAKETATTIRSKARPSARSTLLCGVSRATRSNRFPPVNCTKEFSVHATGAALPLVHNRAPSAQQLTTLAM